jgi:hypothetical protein
VKTKTPGAEVASWISFAAAAPFKDFAMSRNGSSFAVKFVPSSIFEPLDKVGFARIRGCCQTWTIDAKQLEHLQNIANL